MRPTCGASAHDGECRVACTPQPCTRARAHRGLLLASHALEFDGSGTGALPDGTVGGGGDSVCDATTLGAPLVVRFGVRGLADDVRSVGLRITFAPVHTYVGDLRVRLAAPGGGPAASIFGDTGAGASGDDGSDAQGQYQFADEGALD